MKRQGNRPDFAELFGAGQTAEVAALSEHRLEAYAGLKLSCTFSGWPYTAP